MLFDTRQLSKDLQESFSPQQAETLACVFASAGDDQLATKADIAVLDAGMTVLKGDVAVLTERFGDIED